MSLSQEKLVAQLTAIVGLHPGGPSDTGGHTPKPLIGKTLRYLAKQLRKAAWKAAHPTAKQLRRTLSSRLTVALEPFLDQKIQPDGDVAKAINKTTKRLAARLVKLQRKQDKQLAKARHLVAQGSAAEPSLPPTEVARPAPAARSAAAPKLPVLPVVLAPKHLVAVKTNGFDGEVK